MQNHEKRQYSEERRYNEERQYSEERQYREPVTTSARRALQKIFLRAKVGQWLRRPPRGQDRTASFSVMAEKQTHGTVVIKTDSTNVHIYTDVLTPPVYQYICLLCWYTETSAVYLQYIRTSIHSFIRAIWPVHIPNRVAVHRYTWIHPPAVSIGTIIVFLSGVCSATRCLSVLNCRATIRNRIIMK